MPNLIESRSRLAALAVVDALGALAGRGASAPADMQLRVEQSFEDLQRYAGLGELVADTLSPYRRSLEHSFLVDQARSQLGVADDATLDRLEMQARAENFDPAFPNPYLLAELAPLATGARPLTDLLSVPAPALGATVTVARVTTGATAEAQDGANTTVTPSVIALEAEEFDLATVFGGTFVSRQLLRRAPETVDRIVAGEVAGAWGSMCEFYVINGSGTDGQPVGLLNTADISAVTYTDGSPTAGEFAAKVAAAATASEAARGLSPDTVVMHPRRWFHTLATIASDSAGRISATPRPGAPGQAVGTICGLDVIISSEIPTDLGDADNQDIAIVLRSVDAPVIETPPSVDTKAPSAFAEMLDAGWSSWIGVDSAIAVLGWRYPEAIVTIGGTGMIPVAS